MKHRFVSINVVIARILDSFGDAATEAGFSLITQWISEVVTHITGRDVLMLKSQEFEVCDHRLHLPCDVRAIMAVEYEGCRLRYGNSVRDFTRKKEQKETNAFRAWLPEIEVHKLYDKDDNLLQSLYGTNRFSSLVLNEYTQHEGEFYTVEPEYMKFSFEKGIIVLHYLTPHVDEKGNLMVPNNQNLFSAIEYYVMYKTLGRGIKHPLFKSEGAYYRLKQEYTKHLKKAKGELYFPTPDEAASLAAYFSRYMDIRSVYNEYFEHTEQPVNPLTVNDQRYTNGN